jgi:hypothetical protein
MHQMSQEMEEGMMIVRMGAVENLSRNQNLVTEKMMITGETMMKEKAEKEEEKAIQMNLTIV